MPVILTKPDEIEMWMSAPAPEALKLQRALPDDALRVGEGGCGSRRRAARRLRAWVGISQRNHKGVPDFEFANFRIFRDETRENVK